MDIYPTDFPHSAQAYVEAAKLRAEGVVNQTRKKLRLRDGEEDALNAVVVRYIMSVFHAFAHEACDLGRQRKWPVVKVDQHAREFLKKLAVLAFNEKGIDAEGHRLSKVVNSSGHIYDWLWREFMDSKEWEDFCQEMLGVADLQAGIRPIDIGAPPVPYPLSLHAPPAPFFHEQRSSISIQIEDLMNECRLTQEELAGKVGNHPSTVWRHISGALTPRTKALREYEELFTKLLNRSIVIKRNASKRK